MASGKSIDVKADWHGTRSSRFASTTSRSYAPMVKFVSRAGTRPLQVNAIAKPSQRSSPGGFKCPVPSRSDVGFLRHWEFD